MIRYLPGSIVTIAASISNGGGASLAAAEQDTRRWITAVVVGEPQVNMNMQAGAQVREGGSVISAAGKPLADYMDTREHAPAVCRGSQRAGCGTESECAAARDHARDSGGTLLVPHHRRRDFRQRPAKPGFERTRAIARSGLRSRFGFPAGTDVGLAGRTGRWGNYANAYAGSGVSDNLCGFSFGTTDVSGSAAAPAGNSPMLNVFGTGNGVPPTNGINLVYSVGTTGAADHRPATGDASYTGTACLPALRTQGDSAMAASVSAVRVSAKLQNKPTIIVQGRSDSLIPVNHSSRAYLAQNSISDGADSRLSLYEITNGQHFDAFPSVAGFDTRFIPVHCYYLQALNLMWDHLKRGAPLPPSQVVRTTPRGGAPGQAPQLTATNLPAITNTPGANAIAVGNGVVDIRIEGTSHCRSLFALQSGSNAAIPWCISSLPTVMLCISGAPSAPPGTRRDHDFSSMAYRRLAALDLRSWAGIIYPTSIYTVLSNGLWIASQS